MHKNRQFIKSLKQVRVEQMIMSVTVPVLKGRGRQGCARVGRGWQGCAVVGRGVQGCEWVCRGWQG